MGTELAQLRKREIPPRPTQDLTHDRAGNFHINAKDRWVA